MKMPARGGMHAYDRISRDGGDPHATRMRLDSGELGLRSTLRGRGLRHAPSEPSTSFGAYAASARGGGVVERKMPSEPSMSLTEWSTAPSGRRAGSFIRKMPSEPSTSFGAYLAA